MTLDPVPAAGAPLERPAPAAAARGRRHGRPAGAPAGFRASEKECQATIVDAARTTGWRVLAIRPALNRRDRWASPIQGDPGYPDLTLIHPVARRAMFVELKRKPNTLEPDQAAWGEALIAAGQVWRVVWVPEELDRFCQELADLAVAPRPL